MGVRLTFISFLKALFKDGTYKRQFTIVTDLSGVKYKSLNDYLKAEKLEIEAVSSLARILVSPMILLKLVPLKALQRDLVRNFLVPFAGAFLGDSQAVMDPTGLGNRYIPYGGAGNTLASMAIDQEYRAIYEITVPQKCSQYR